MYTRVFCLMQIACADAVYPHHRRRPACTVLQKEMVLRKHLLPVVGELQLDSHCHKIRRFCSSESRTRRQPSAHGIRSATNAQA